MSFMQMSIKRLMAMLMVGLFSLVFFLKAYDGLVVGFVTAGMSRTRYSTSEILSGPAANRVGFYYLLGALACIGVIVWMWKTREEDLDT